MRLHCLQQTGNMLKLILLLTALIGHLSGNPIHKQPVDIDEEFQASETGPQSSIEADEASRALQGDHYGGDMIFPESWNTSNGGIKNTNFRWLGFPGSAVVPYIIDESANVYRKLILQGMELYHKSTCIRFVPRTIQEDYIRIFYGTGCSSVVGRRGGQQDLSLGKGCGYVGSVVHELGHAIGLFHVHQRSDRDNYIHVYLNNIKPGKEDNFVAKDPKKELKYTQYDYNSIMHYGNYAFSRERGTLLTMVAKNNQRLTDPHEKEGFSKYDLETISKLYQCR